MTRDSASGKGPEPDSAKEVPETPGAASEEASSTDATKPVAVDTTDDAQDTTDEGALSADSSTSKDSKEEGEAPNLTLKPLPTSAASKTGAKDSTDSPENPAEADASGDSADSAAATPATAATTTTAAETKVISTPETTEASSASPVAATAPVTSTPEATEASSASTATDGPTEVTPEPVSSETSSAQETLGDVPPPARPERHSTLVPLVGTLVALAAVAALLIGSMALPNAKSGPNGVPVGVAGEEAIVGQISTLMTEFGNQFGGEGTFQIEQYTSRDELREATENREVYGGLFVDDTSAEMLVATAGGIEVSNALQAVASALQQQAQAQVTVTDVVAQPQDDLQGRGLGAAELPLAIAAALPAFGLIVLYRRRPLAQIGGAVLAAGATGLAIAAVLTYGSGSTADGNFALLVAGLAAGTLAMTLILLGVHALTGRIGLGIAAAILVLFGAPLSGLSSVPEWLPDPWGTLGQMLPTGATATALRSMAFFDGAGSRAALLVMLMWSVVGLLLLGLGTLLHRSNQRLASLEADEQAELNDSDDEKAPAAV